MPQAFNDKISQHDEMRQSGNEKSQVIKYITPKWQNLRNRHLLAIMLTMNHKMPQLLEHSLLQRGMAKQTMTPMLSSKNSTGCLSS